MAADDEDKTVMLGGNADGRNYADTITLGSAPKARLVCLDDSLLNDSQKSLEIILDKGSVTVGRGDDNSHPIHSPKISRNHARFFPEDGRWIVEDLNSTNGVWINEERIQKASRLYQGDYVKVGAIPFNFTLDRPDIASSPEETSGDDDEGGGTVFIGGGSGRAEGLLQEAEKKREEQARTEQERPKHSAPKREAPSTQGMGESQGLAGKLAKWGVIALLVVGGGGYYAWNLLNAVPGVNEQQVVAKNIRDFFVRYEDVPGMPSANQLKEQIATLNKELAQVEKNMAEFSANKQFLGQYAQLLVYKLERDLVLFIGENRPGEAEAMADKAFKVISDLRSQGGGERAEEASRVATLAKSVAVIKRLTLTYPKPSPNAVNKPGKNDMAVFDAARSTFIEEKKNPKVNAALSVGYPFFNRVVMSVDETDLPLVEQWKSFVNN